MLLNVCLAPEASTVEICCRENRGSKARNRSRLTHAQPSKHSYFFVVLFDQVARFNAEWGRT